MKPYVLRAILAYFVVVFTFGNGNAPAEADVSPISVSKLFIFQDPNFHLEWTTCISFKNETTREIQAIKFGFTYIDAFDSPVAQFSGDRVGQFSPGAEIEGPSDPSFSNGTNQAPQENCWRDVQQVGSLSAVQVQILKIRYFGGEVWVNPKPQSVFTGEYLVNNPPPARIKCLLGLTFSWSYAQGVPGCQHAIKEWYAHDAWVTPTAQSSPSPSPSPSPTQNVT